MYIAPQDIRSPATSTLSTGEGATRIAEVLRTVLAGVELAGKALAMAEAVHGVRLIDPADHLNRERVALLWCIARLNEQTDMPPPTGFSEAVPYATDRQDSVIKLSLTGAGLVQVSSWQDGHFDSMYPPLGVEAALEALDSLVREIVRPSGGEHATSLV